MKEEDNTTKEEHYFTYLKQKLEKIESMKTEEEKVRDQDPDYTGQRHSKQDYALIQSKDIGHYVRPLVKELPKEENKSEYKEQFPEMVKLSKKKPIDYSKLLIDETIDEEGKRSAV